MFKRLEASWNAHTPVYLHNGTKENLIFQLMLVVLMLFGFFVKDKCEERRDRRRYNTDNQN